MEKLAQGFIEDVQENFVSPVIANGPMVIASFSFWLGLQLFMDYGFPKLFPKWTQQIIAASSKDNWGNIRTRVMGTSSKRWRGWEEFGPVTFRSHRCHLRPHHRHCLRAVCEHHCWICAAALRCCPAE